MTIIACLCQAMLQILGYSRTIQRPQSVLKGNALLELTQAGATEHFIQFRLAKQHHLQQLGAFGFQVSEQAQRFDGVFRHGLGFVDDQHHVAPLAGQAQSGGR